MQSDKPVVPISLWGRPMGRREQAGPPESTAPETICGLKVHPVANMFPLLAMTSSRCGIRFVRMASASP